MDFSVMRRSREMVKPSEETPSGTLDLSMIDRLPVLRSNARTLHVFRHGPNDASRVIRYALSKALVPYYPLAGRLKKSSQDELQIECSSRGVWFVEASSDPTLDSVNFFHDVESIPYDRLLPDRIVDERGLDDPLVQMQMTQFACGGFVIGLIFCHSICDGLGAAQFLTAVGELARAVYHLIVTPVWNRDFIPPSPTPETTTVSSIPNLPPPIPNYTLQHANIDIPIDHITKIKQQFNKSTEGHETCSSFEIVAAALWIGRTRAINFKQNIQLQLVFFANCRQFINPPLPKGFYGNCFFPVTVTASSEFLSRASNFAVVKLIKEAKSKLPIEFAKYVKKIGSGDPFAQPLEYTTLFISEWGRLGFNEIDYGWGPPVHVIPIQGSSVIPVGIMGWLPLPRKGIRLMTWCVEQAHRQVFIDQIKELTI